MLRYGWRQSFHASAVIGIAAAILWYVFARNTPEKHPWVNAAELRAIHSGQPSKSERVLLPQYSLIEARKPVRTSWRAICTNRNVWLLFCSAATCGYLV